MNMNCGIYKISFPSGRFYIGSSQNLKRRLEGHRSGMKHNKHPNVILQNAWNKYGENNCKFEILLVCSIENLLWYEQRALDIWKPALNTAKCAGASMRGRQTPDDVKAKLSVALKGRKREPFSAETKAKMSVAKKGKHNSAEHCAKISAAVARRWARVRKEREELEIAQNIFEKGVYNSGNEPYDVPVFGE